MSLNFSARGDRRPSRPFRREGARHAYVYWDIETRSAASICASAGAHVYAIDPTTQPLCLAYAVDDGEPQLWLPTEPTPPLFLDIAANPGDWRLVAHNWEFERTILEHVLIPRYGFQPIPIEIQHCTPTSRARERLSGRTRPPRRGARPAVPKGSRGATGDAGGVASEGAAQAQARHHSNVGRGSREASPRSMSAASSTSSPRERCSTRPSSSLSSRPSAAINLQDAAINARGVRLDRQFTTAAMDLAVPRTHGDRSEASGSSLGAITSVNQSRPFPSGGQRARPHDDHGQQARRRSSPGAISQTITSAQLLELRQMGARAASTNSRRCCPSRRRTTIACAARCAYLAPATGRWTGLGPQLQNLKKNESGLPLSVVDSVRRGDRADIAQYGAPLALLGDLSRATLCAAPGMELMSGDFSAIESVVLAWLAGETWKLDAYRTFQRDRRHDARAVSGDRAQDARQGGRRGDHQRGATARQGGRTGVRIRRIGRGLASHPPHDSRTDDEIKAIIHQWRAAHPQTRKFWNDLARALRIAIRTGQPILVAPRHSRRLSRRSRTEPCG